MGPTKRKAVSQAVDGAASDVPKPGSKKLKMVRGQDTETSEVDGTINTAQSPDGEYVDPTDLFWNDPADDSENEYRPDDDSEVESDGETQEAVHDELDLAPAPKRGRSKKGSTNAKLDAKAAREKLIAEQLEFVIHARDNNMPDPYGTNSTTTGKLHYPEVAKLYNERFGLKVGAAAMEKRYRTRIDKYCEVHPSYPRNIKYAKKDPAAKRAPKDIAAARQPQPDANNAREVREVKKQPPKKPRRKVYQPPEELREAADLIRYVEDQWNDRDAEHPEWLHILVEDGHRRQLGNVLVRSNDLLKTSDWYAKEREHTRVQRVTIRGLPRLAIERYVQCVSSEGTLALPEFDFALAQFRKMGGRIEHRPACFRISWDIDGLIDLYSVATLLKDDIVRNLVMDRWRSEFLSGGELKIDPSHLNNLFATTEAGDPAQSFWAVSIHSLGLAEEICSGTGWNDRLVAKLNFLNENGSLGNPFVRWDDDAFCRGFHRHVGNHGCHRNESIEEAVSDFQAISRRLLIAQGNMPDELLATVDDFASKLKAQYECLKAGSD
ncbi:hypothetical protein BU26DRAFT_597192 [Trematosphaeria pertusa]|uniref:Uncharacterized protein n=1 Tax=Trematosphaeria pertusa TaxID=390896 RepID=A0A6A6ICN5_9PLEO|nr:uncharacterized protein BU26DRAFT_597192 [Trematosphaeria pertusa]KAF2247310.1 hypothetical protein BU26DRAFT_597192 [Trematosphaeria pertusa]